MRDHDNKDRMKTFEETFEFCLEEGEWIGKQRERESRIHLRLSDATILRGSTNSYNRFHSWAKNATEKPRMSATSH